MYWKFRAWNVMPLVLCSIATIIFHKKIKLLMNCKKIKESKPFIPSNTIDSTNSDMRLALCGICLVHRRIKECFGLGVARKKLIDGPNWRERILLWNDCIWFYQLTASCIQSIVSFVHQLIASFVHQLIVSFVFNWFFAWILVSVVRKGAESEKGLRSEGDADWKPDSCRG